MKTVGELKDKLRKYSDTEEIAFLKEDELCCFIDMAIKKANLEICKLNKDHMVDCEEQDIEECTESISLPSDIQGTKIKKVLWLGVNDCDRCCTLKRLPYDCFENCKKGTPGGYQFFNKKEEGNRLYLIPQNSKPGKIRIIYSRKPCDITEDTPDGQELENTDLCNFVFWEVLTMIYAKEKNNGGVGVSSAYAQEALQLVIDCMCPQFADDQECEIETDKCWEGYINEC